MADQLATQLHFPTGANTQSSSSLECLGLTFENDEARRTYFLEKLGEKLKDPEFRKIEGFPIGSDEDILALSDPPYYTACPNPFAADVSEGKNDPIYNAHSYHTKVPHKAIMRYILHYTEPGDMVFDGFCGTGMTGVAAQLCGDKATVEALGERVTLERSTIEEGAKRLSIIGPRRSILSDLSPAATFISRGYNTSFVASGFSGAASRILDKCEEELRSIYTTSMLSGSTTTHENRIYKATGYEPVERQGIIDYVVWSDQFHCSNCGEIIILWNAIIDPETRHRQSRTEVPCPRCKHLGDIRQMSRVLESYHDSALGKVAQRVRQEAILIQYRVQGAKYEKSPDIDDWRVLRECDAAFSRFDKWYPCLPMPNGLRKAKDAYHLRGITHTHHFYSPRSLMAFATIWYEISRYNGLLGHQLRFWVQSVALGFTKLNRYFESSYSQVNRYMKGTFYVAPFISEVRPGYALRGKIRKLAQLDYAKEEECFISTGSSGNLPIPADSIDYIFVDPPFGRNLQYSELNFLWESWLRVRTDSGPEAIVDETVCKERDSYHGLMEKCFCEFYRILKPGRWMTVEFHNAENAIWNIIQESLLQAGFVVADVRVLDKKQITMQQWVGTNVVSKDLVISCYKPNDGFEKRFQREAGTEDGVWDFVRTHLKQLPVFVSKDGQAEVIAERQNYLLFDRMVAFHVQRGVTVPLSATEFYYGLEQRFPLRDGMYFLPEQVAEYDKKRMTVREILQLELYVIDESSAIQWFKQQLTRKPQTFQELHPQFLREIGGWQKHEKPLELSELLEQNFLCYDGKGEVPSQIHSYLSTNFKELRNLRKDHESLISKGKDRWYVPDPNKASDLEKLRERALLKEFEEYRASSQKGLKVFRLEVVRAGFKKAWQERDYATIIAVASKIPETILQEDPKLLMWYDQALTRTGGDA